MKKVLFILFALFTSHVYADTFGDCIQKIMQTSDLWDDNIANIFDTDELTIDIVKNKKSKIYTLLAADVLSLCRDNLAEIAQSTAEKIIYFSYNGKKYGFKIKSDQIFDYMDIRTGLLIINKKNLSSGDVVELSDIPEKQKFFTSECSDWNIAFNLDDDAAVNKAGQTTFNEFGGSTNEFFLDFAEGDNRRAFPGLVLMDKTNSTQEYIVSYRNVKTGIEKAQQFSTKLKNSACSNQGLSLYLVALDVKKDTTSERAGWLLGTSVAGGALVWLGASAAAVTSGAAVGSGILAGTLLTGGVFAEALGVSAALATVPVAGWIAAGLVLTGVAVTTALWPAEIEDLQQVMVLDGPYNL